MCNRLLSACFLKKNKKIYGFGRKMSVAIFGEIK